MAKKSRGKIHDYFAHLIGISTFFWVFVLLGCTSPPDSVKTERDQGRADPEIASQSQDFPVIRSPKAMVVSANPLASAAGKAILERGGSALDALIASQMVLNLVEPQSSGIGGGGFLLYFDRGTQTLTSFDGRETAPRAVKEDLFLTADGSAMKFFDAVVGGRAVGVPGLIAMLEQAHKKYGRLPWAELFEPAIKLAETGFAVSDRLHHLLANDRYLMIDAKAKALYYPDGVALAVGHPLKNPELAESLRQVATQGWRAFQTGNLGVEIVKAIQNHPGNPGYLSQSDLIAYKAKQRPPICFAYRDHVICSMAPPSSGALTLGQILKTLEPFDLAGLAPTSAQAAHLIAEASKLAFADRERYIADDDFVEVPSEGLLDDFYLLERTRQINPGKAMDKALPGIPPGTQKFAQADGSGPEHYSTTHISIVDQNGNAASMTSSIENAFGARLMAGGFLLNNQLTDFSFVPKVNDRPVANRVQPGKRPRSSMTPTMVFDHEGHLRYVLGSPGGSRIIGYVAQTIIALIDWKLSAQQAVSLGHITNRNGTTDLETGQASPHLQSALEQMGHKVRVVDQTSGLHVITLGEGYLESGIDPRREGSAAGY